ncbi:hypothetical protein NUM3379_00970 [Kineococcus sp. NUM-3379]
MPAPRSAGSSTEPEAVEPVARGIAVPGSMEVAAAEYTRTLVAAPRFAPVTVTLARVTVAPAVVDLAYVAALIAACTTSKPAGALHVLPSRETWAVYAPAGRFGPTVAVAAIGLLGTSGEAPPVGVPRPWRTRVPLVNAVPVRVSRAVGAAPAAAVDSRRRPG